MINISSLLVGQVEDPVIPEIIFVDKAELLTTTKDLVEIPATEPNKTLEELLELLKTKLDLNDTITSDSKLPITTEVGVAGVHVQPQISVNLPSTLTRVKKNKIGIRGHVIDVKTLIVNGKPTWFNNLGYFYVVLPLKKGMNEIVFKAFSRTEDYVKIIRTVLVN